MSLIYDDLWTYSSSIVLVLFLYVYIAGPRRMSFSHGDDQPFQYVSHNAVGSWGQQHRQHQRARLDHAQRISRAVDVRFTVSSGFLAPTACVYLFSQALGTCVKTPPSFPSPSDD